MTPPAGAHPAGDLLSGATGMSMRRFSADRELPGGLDDWGARPGWAGFTRPVQNLNRQYTKIETAAPVVGGHLQAVSIDPDSGTVASMMGDPCDGGHLYPAEGEQSLGFEMRAGRP